MYMFEGIIRRSWHVVISTWCNAVLLLKFESIYASAALHFLFCWQFEYGYFLTPVSFLAYFIEHFNQLFCLCFQGVTYGCVKVVVGT